MKLNLAPHSVACEYPTMEHIIPTLALHEEAVRCECLSGTVVISSVSSNVSVWFAAESPLQTFHTTTPSMIKPAATASVSTVKIQGYSMPWSPVFLMFSLSVGLACGELLHPNDRGAATMMMVCVASFPAPACMSEKTMTSKESKLKTLPGCLVAIYQL